MIKIVVPVSGGKDSQVCLKMAVAEHGAEAVRGLFCDTGWEHPLTYKHLDTMQSLYQVRIDRVQAGNVPENIRKLKLFPSSRIRFCTDRLKIQPSNRYYQVLAKAQGGYQVWCGMRADESVDRAKRYAEREQAELYSPHDINASYPKLLDKLGVTFRLPILYWSIAEVMDYLAGEENPLYRAGFKRVGCFPCLASSPGNIRNAYEFDEFGASQKRIVMQLESEISKKHEPSETGQTCLFCQI